LTNSCLEDSSISDIDENEIVLLPYCDNGNVIGCDRSKVDRVANRIISCLRRHGFGVHEITAARSDVVSLGWRAMASVALLGLLKRV